MNVEIAVTGLIGLIVAASAYWFQKTLDRREQVKERHYVVYVEIVEAICDMANSHNRDGAGIEDALASYAKAKMKFAIVASEEALTAFAKFDGKITSGEKVPHGEFDSSLGDFMKALRAENLGGTEIQQSDLVLLTPFGRSLDRRQR